MKWFKFYGQDYLCDPKILALSASERSCWITLLSYGSISDNGMITFLDEEQLMRQSGVSTIGEEWDRTSGVLKKLEKLKMITLDNEVITILNWQKRQETSLTGYERVKRYREKKRDDNAMITLDNANDNAMITSDKIRIDKNINIYTDSEKILEEAESGFDDKPIKASSAKFNKATDEVFKYFCEKFNFFRKTNKGPAPHTVDSAINVEKTSKAVREHFSNDIEAIKKYIDTLAKQAMKEGWFKKVSSFRLLEKHLTNYQRTATKSQSSGKYDTPEQLQEAHEKLKKMRKEAEEWEKERNRIDLEEYNENEN